MDVFGEKWKKNGDCSEKLRENGRF
jgi:hypothetical protein